MVVVVVVALASTAYFCVYYYMHTKCEYLIFKQTRRCNEKLMCNMRSKAISYIAI